MAHFINFGGEMGGDRRLVEGCVGRLEIK